MEMSSRTSGVTGGDLTGFAEQEEVSNLDMFRKGPCSSEWTDEKHSLYLKSMEASFVHQLYNSMEANCLNSHKKHQLNKRSCKHGDSQTMGQGIKLGRGEPPPQQSADCQSPNGNPWIQKFRARGRHNQAAQEISSVEGQTMRCEGRMMYTCGLVNVAERSRSAQAYQDASVSREYSDQNFDDDDTRGTLGLNIMKRVKAVARTK